MLDEKAGNAVGKVQRLFPNTLRQLLRLWGEARKATKVAKPSPSSPHLPTEALLADGQSAPSQPPSLPALLPPDLLLSPQL